MHKHRTRAGLAAALAATLWTALSFCATAAGAAEPKLDERHVVFAHYMVCFGSSVEFYKQEMMLAQANNVDGFALNCGGWGTVDPKTKEFKPGPYVRSAERIYEAAKQLDNGFKLMMSPDLACLRNLDANIPDMVTRFHNHPNQFRHGGKVVLSGYAGTPQSYAGPIKKLKDAGHDVCFVAYVGSGRHQMAWSMESVLRLFAGQPHMDGLLRFTCDDSPWGMMRTNSIGRRATQHLGKIYMAGIAPYYASANIRDMQGMRGYGAMWEGIIRDDADWVEIITWNDYNEDSNLMPYKWKRMWDKPAFNRDGSYLDVTSYYSAWFKSGVRPPIKQDKLFFAYRNRPRDLRRAWDPKQEKWVDVTLVKWPYDQLHDDVRDYVYVTTFLKAPAELTVRMGGTERLFNMPEGVGHAEVPMAAGAPRFLLRRNGKALTDAVGRRSIITEATGQNSRHIGHHLLNRIWAGGVVAGGANWRQAEDGELHGDAVVVEEGNVKAVKNTEKDGSGFTVPVKGLDDAMYNVRILYRNPGGPDARLTLIADGPPRSDSPEDKAPYFIPVWLPPTGEAWERASFFWPLYKKTTFLKLQWMAGRYNGKLDRPEWDDVGSVMVDEIQLVKVEPTTVPERRKSVFPGMVHVPGGAFTMGSEEGQTDEKPVHKVTLSPFAIGKYEVTNQEFEMFDPGHRRWRDGYSWRNREPVIYVKWREGASYCNWLSKEAGLAAVYDEKTWEANMKADGFRLPTEAEWEYVAAGREEGRKYPWGKDDPQPGVHGNFIGEKALEVDPNVRSNDGAGVTVVGSYPAGASRDGVMDMAGNAAEWCSDYYNHYPAEAQTDPHCTIKGTHAVIRGGSWGYYGYSQRCADREFNNPGYGGYIYVGFRVALPEAGWKKIKDRLP